MHFDVDGDRLFVYANSPIDAYWLSKTVDEIAKGGFAVRVDTSNKDCLRVIIPLKIDAPIKATA